MKISVIVPTYNTGEGLYTLFNSLKNQTIGFEDIEVIFVDDNSSDQSTLDILDDLSSFDNVSLYHLDENSGFPGKGRNIGLSKAKGEYIIFSDHDDSYNKDALKTMYDEATKNKSDMVICNFNQVNNGKIKPFKSDLRKETILNSYKDNIDIFQVPAAIWTRLFKRDFLIRNNISFLEGMLCEDVYVATLATFKGSNIVYLPDLYGYNYSIRDSNEDKSTIHLRNKKYIEAILDGYLEICKWLDTNYNQYGKNIFKKHLTSWLYTIVLSDLNDNDRLDLFNKAHIIFKKYYTEDPYFKGNYKNLVQYIINGKFKLAVDESYRIASFQENINEETSFLKKIKNKILR